MDLTSTSMCSVIGQVIHGVVQVLEEIVLKDSNTLAACEASSAECEPGSRVIGPYLFPSLGTPLATAVTPRPLAPDWQIVNNFLHQPLGEFNFTNQVRHVNPALKDRLNCVNAMLRNQAGEHRLRVDPRCTELLRDFDQVCGKTDPNGNPFAELDQSDPMRRHVSDALGNMIAAEFSMFPAGGYRGEYLA